MDKSIDSESPLSGFFRGGLVFRSGGPAAFRVQPERDPGRSAVFGVPRGFLEHVVQRVSDGAAGIQHNPTASEARAKAIGRNA